MRRLAYKNIEEEYIDIASKVEEYIKQGKLEEAKKLKKQSDELFDKLMKMEYLEIGRKAKININKIAMKILATFIKGK